MQLRGRFWVVAGTGTFLALWAVVVAEPLVLAGAVGVAGWLLAQQYRFVRAAAATVDELTVGHAPDRGHVTAGDSSTVSLVVGAERPLALPAAVSPTVPPGVDGSAPTLSLSAGDRQATTTYEVQWAVAGEHALPAPTVCVRDGLGLFEQRVAAGGPTTVSVAPRAPRNVHVGEGGERAAAFGEHVADRTASGVEPSSVRPYVPGDAVRQIDWKATARLGEAHVREFVGETDRVTVLVVDHRGSMADGPPGERKLDFARQVGLAFVETARDLSDSLGCVTVGDGGLTTSTDPAGSTDHLQTVRQRLETLEPTGGRRPPARAAATSATRAQHLRSHLDEETQFGRRLRPYVERPHAYVERVADRPLFRAVESVTSRQGGGTWTVVLTDDADRNEVRETVKMASRTDGGVVVFLTPTVLFEPPAARPAPADARERYVDFEAFRRKLASYPGVWAFEVGPGERLSTVLSAGGSGRQPARAGGWGE